jgi:hypothetical protein
MFNEWEAATKGVGADCRGCESEVVATMQQCWTNSPPTELPPSIQSIDIDDKKLAGTVFKVELNALINLQVHAIPSYSKPLTAVWGVTQDVYSSAIGGAYEENIPLLRGLWPQASSATGLGLQSVLNTSLLTLGKAYRLYVFLRPRSDAFLSTPPQHEAHASLAFYTCHDAVMGETCYDHVTYGRRVGIHSHPQTYPGVNASSSFAEFQTMLYQKGVASCPMPCSIPDGWCHTAVQGDECYAHVAWAMHVGIVETPARYPGLSASSSFTDFQFALYKANTQVCTMPCIERWGWMLR